jgi:hypothetical protein
MDISDPKELFSPNRENMIIEKLSAKFVGVCYMSCFVVKINKIIRRSYIYMKDTLDGDAHTNIMFEVDAIIYQKNEIINGCKIIKKEPNGIIHGKSKYAGVQLSIQPNMLIFKEGDIVPVIVKRVRYNINQTAISVLAAPFIPANNDQIYYNIIGSLSNQQLGELKSVLEQIKSEEEKIKKLNVNDKKIYTFFNDLLSPLKISNNKDVQFKNVKKVNIHDILELKMGIIYKPKLKYNDPTIYFSSIDTTNTDVVVSSDLSSIATEKMENNKITERKNHTLNNIVDESAYIIFYSILINYLSTIQSLLDFINQYPTFDSVQKSKELWKMFTMLKK